MKKEKFFSKFNIRNFNDRLEEVLANKSFLENVKNNILNVVYKIEESYNDYEIAKVEVPNEKDFLENILVSIRDYCNLIEVSNSKELKERKFIIDYEKGNIKVLSNTTWILYSILEISKVEKKYQSELDMTQNKPIFDFLKIGYNINNVEVIRDFNGWSWITSPDEIPNIKANLIYQNLQFLLGNRAMENFMQNIIIQDKDLIDILQKKLEEKYNKEIIRKILNRLKLISIIEVANIDEKYKNILSEIRHRRQEEYNLMENKKEYLKEITYMKKTNIEIIKGIDKTINNRELLQIEYKLRNSMLKNNEKIFSVSYLVDILNEERKEALNKISEINTLMEPKTYVNKKDELRNMIDELTINDKNTYENIIELQKLFIKCMIHEIKTVSEKVDIINLLYKIRYYLNILFDENKYIKDILELNKDIENLKEKIILKSIKNNLLVEFSDDKDINKKILINILDTKTINLQTLYIILTKENDKVKIELFDEDELVKVETIDIENMEEKNIKFNKKIKIFV